MILDATFLEVSQKFDTEFDILPQKFEAEFITLPQTFAVEFDILPQTFQTDFGDVQTITKYVGGDIYTGSYAIVPKIKAQTIPTKDKVMIDDVKIEKIPITTVSNSSGGNTVIIGG